MPSAYSRLASGGLAAAALLALGLAACSSSSHKATTATTATTTPATSATVSPASTAAPSGALTIKTASVTDYGTVLVNAQGYSLYILSSEAHGHVTSTSSNGCATFWPPVELPSGVASATAGAGVNASLLGVAVGPDGSHRVTYAGYPLYTYAADHSPGEVKGEGITSFGGTWYLVSPSGQPVTGMVSSGTTSTTTSGGYGGGY